MKKTSIIIVLIILSVIGNNFLCFGQKLPIIIQDKRELFIDDFLIEKLNNLDMRLGTPVSAGVALKFNEPWEGKFCTYISIINDGNIYRMYYRGSSKFEVTCYAESTDGINWVKPKLRLYEVDGTLDNNVIMIDTKKKRITHNMSVLYDSGEGIPAGERFKAVGGASDEKKPYLGLYRYISADGIHWNQYNDTTSLFHDYALDSQNVLTWVPAEKCYAIYLRGWTGAKPGELYPAGGVRTIFRSVSKDFVNWSKPEMMQFGDTPLEHLYTNATHPYFRAQQIMISMPFRFSPKARVLTDVELTENGTDSSQWNGVADGVFMTSRGGNVYNRKFLESFIRPGLEQKNWGARSNIPSLGVIPTGAGEMSLFVTRAYGTKDVFLERMKLRTDGFTSLHAGFTEGYALTKPLLLRDNTLLINYSTASKGYVKVILIGEDGKEIPGFGESDAKVITGDKIDGKVIWANNKSLKDLSNTKVRIKFVIKDADLYSFGVFTYKD
ncbi:MAG: hypothetical protein LLG13_17770 [Bacteroidales bacterium]|nr:hypothetical protein [Bacteroidales bacterium]